MKGIAGVAALGAVILLAAMAGCGSKKLTQPQIQQPAYLPSSTPQNVLDNMRRAYERRDSTAYDSLFDANYQGTSTDMANPGGTVILNFTKGDERGHMGRLARSHSILSVFLDFGTTLIRYRNSSDPAGWATIQSTTVRLEINANPSSYMLASTNELIEFKFEPTTPSAGSPTDTTWHIIRWTEIHQ